MRAAPLVTAHLDLGGRFGPNEAKQMFGYRTNVRDGRWHRLRHR